MRVTKGRNLKLVQPGQQVSAADENTVRQLLQEVVRSPASQDQGDDAGEAARTLTETSRTTETVRIYQDGDPTSENYVDVQRVRSLNVRDSLSGELWTIILSN